MTEEGLQSWFNDKSAATVNEGSLVFLAVPLTKPVHHHQNRIRISADSLKTGWIKLTQCHDHLDQVSRSQITFREGYVKGLRVLESRAIKEVWVEGASVQLRQISANARICLEAQTRALKEAGNGYFNLLNGPYMRKFLDGYYPMRVSLKIKYPAHLLQVTDIAPAAQPGFEVRHEPGLVNMQGVFEGELRTLIQFEKRAPGSN